MNKIFNFISIIQNNFVSLHRIYYKPDANTKPTTDVNNINEPYSNYLIKHIISYERIYCKNKDCRSKV